MLVLPDESKALLTELPIPDDLRVLPNNLLLNFVVSMTSEYRDLVQDLSRPAAWSRVKKVFSERCEALKIGDYVSLYEHPERFFALAMNVSFISDIKEIVASVAKEHGFEDVASQPSENADPERLRVFTELVLEAIMAWVVEVDQAIDETDESSIDEYWKNVHPKLPLEQQQKVEKDAQISACLFMFGFHNAISVMAYGKSLTSLVQRALSSAADADTAMCRAVRVDNSLRHHPKFMERYLIATNNSEKRFINQYNITTSPLTNKIRFPGLYFLLSLLDGFGILGQLTNPQLLDLCDHAKLDRWENRIEDAGYLAKRRLAFIQHKFS